MTRDLLTLKEAAEHLDCSPTTLKRRIASGELVPAVRGRRAPGECHLYHLADIEVFREEIHKPHRTKEQQAWLDAGERPCCSCGQVKPFSEFHKHKIGLGGHSSRCKDCSREVSKAEWESPEGRERRRQRYAQWEKNNPDKKSKSRKNYRERNRDRILARQREYFKSRRPSEEARRRCAARNRFYRSVRQSLEAGFTSPICKRTGFSVVTADRGYRAARRDKPLPTGEVALCYFEFLPAAGRWIVNEPLTVPPGFRAESERVIAYCVYQLKTRYRKFARGVQHA